MTSETTFRKLYLELWPRLESLLRAHPEMSPPLLLNPPDDYQGQRIHLFVVGQETATWYDDLLRGKEGNAAIDTLMHIYKNDFRLGQIHPTPFWQAVRDLERALGIEKGAILWSNLNKADQNGGRPSPALEVALLESFPALRREIAVAQPDAVVFFTGPRYDDLLTSIFSGIRFAASGFPERVFAKVIHPALPDRSFRTYHPKYLRIRKMWPAVLSQLTRVCGSVPTSGAA